MADSTMYQEDYAEVISYFKADKTISELYALIERGPTGDSPKVDASKGCCLDVIYLLVNHALNKNYKNYKLPRETYGKFKQLSSLGPLNQSVGNYVDKSFSKVFENWESYLDSLTKQNPQPAPEMKLKQILAYILGFLNKYYSPISNNEPRAKNLIDFLTKECGVSKGDLMKYIKAEDAMNKVRKAIKASADGKKCVIFTGAPGTGKTYCVEKYVEEKMQELEKLRGKKLFEKEEYFVQFHSSYDYTDFVEGLRPVQVDGEENGEDDKKEMVFVRMDGIFKAFCRKVVHWNNLYDLNKKPVRANPPAVSKDGEAGEAAPESGAKQLFYETPDGKQLPYYYFVIDEINRADLGRVFGELMYCFEKRGKEHKIATQYANLPAYGKDGKKIEKVKEEKEEKEEDCFKGGFYIPENVIIIGTMNDIDRSVETFDFALRRRFDWVEIEADAVMESSLEGMMKEWLKKKGSTVDHNIVTGLVERIIPRIKGPNGMNTVIEKQPGLGPEFKIGPAYFNPVYFKECYVNNEPEDALNDAVVKALETIWERNIEPILREYVRGRQSAGSFISDCKAALLPEKTEGQNGQGSESQQGTGQEEQSGSEGDPAGNDS